MTDISVKQMPRFKRAYKKLHKKQRLHVDQAIRTIMKNPEAGQQKKGDLADIFVYKFKVQDQSFLLAYEWFPKTRILHALGVHENFYRDLKNKTKNNR